jgi:hypothetical protein
VKDNSLKQSVNEAISRTVGALSRLVLCVGRIYVVIETI